MLEYPNMKDAKKKQKAQTDKKSKDEDFREGGPIYSRTTSDKKRQINCSYRVIKLQNRKDQLVNGERSVDRFNH